MDPQATVKNIVDFPGRAPRPAADLGLLAPVLARSSTALGGALQAMLGKVDDALFDFMQKAGGDDQQAMLDAMRELRLRRQHIEKAFQDHFRAAFDALKRGKPLTTEQALSGAAPGELSLVSEEDLEEQLGAKMIGQSVQRDFGPVLAQLDLRLGAAAGGVELDASSNPIGSGQVGAAVLVALRGVEMLPRVKLIVFKLYERELQRVLGDLYESVNAELVEAGVLPQLKLVKVKRPESAPAPRQAEPEPKAEQAAPAGPVGANEQALFNTLHQLLSAYRHASGGVSISANASAGAQPIEGGQMLALLGQLQASMPEGLRSAIDDPSQSLAQRLKQEMLQAAAQVGVDPANAKLNPTDEDAIDLVGMLFEVLLDERDLERQVRDMIGRLLVPFIKVAVMDRRMFMQRAHPARKLLNSLAEACEGNRGESPQERALLDKVRHVVDRLIAEFNENIAIFETLEEEFRAFLDQHRRRIELAERRAAEAQRGRERLEEARALAQAEIQARIAGRPVPPTVASVLERYWSHHLTVTALRDGNDSDKYRAAVAAGNAVIGAVDASLVGEALLLPALAPMRAALLDILATSGCVGETAKDVIRAVADELRGLSRGESAESVAPAVAAVAPPPSAEPPKPQDARADLGLSTDPDELDFEADDAERIAQLPVGTWVEFRAEDGSTQPAKLSWVSPISRRLLFVNRRGVRLCVASAEELAAMMREGRLEIREVDTAFERAMHQVLGKLGGDSAEKIDPKQFAA